MAKRDLSKGLGGMTGRAATALRTRQATLDAALGEGGRKPAAKKAMKNAVKGKKRSGY